MYIFITVDIRNTIAMHKDYIVVIVIHIKLFVENIK
jgi:hypothetical protein